MIPFVPRGVNGGDLRETPRVGIAIGTRIGVPEMPERVFPLSRMALNSLLRQPSQGFLASCRSIVSNRDIKPPCRSTVFSISSKNFSRTASSIAI